jgi:transposase-like protein
MLGRRNRGILRNVKIIDSFQTENAAVKIVYIRVGDLNEEWFH